MKPLDTSLIDAIILDFFQRNGIDCSVSVDTDFYYYYDIEQVSYALVVAERTAKLFPMFAKANGLEYETPLFILCLLHEVGHHYTMDDFTEEELCNFEEFKEHLGDSDEDFMAYFSLPDELIATLWAIEFINENPEEIKILDSRLAVALADFIEANEIEE